MYYFGLISEGETDHAVLENILIGYFDEDISSNINQLQPTRGQSGGWSRVITYCKSNDFKNDLADNDFLIIQIDTDRSFEFNVLHDENGDKLSVETLVRNIKTYFETLFKTAFGDTFLDQFGHRILFAVAVHSTECWLLPLYFKADKDKMEIKNCYQKLNTKIEGLTKTYKKYDAISADYRKAKTLKNSIDKNISLNLFFEDLLGKVPKMAKNAKNTEGV